VFVVRAETASLPQGLEFDHSHKFGFLKSFLGSTSLSVSLVTESEMSSAQARHTEAEGRNLQVSRGFVSPLRIFFRTAM